MITHDLDFLYRMECGAEAWLRDVRHVLKRSRGKHAQEADRMVAELLATSEHENARHRPGASLANGEPVWLAQNPKTNPKNEEHFYEQV